MATSGCALATDVQGPIQDTTTTTIKKGTDGVRPASDDGGFHLSNIPLWTRWALVSLLSFAIPLYNNAVRIEGKVEDAAETLVEDVEKVAAVVQKVSAEIADVLPKDSIVEYDFVMIEHFAEEVDDEAEKAEAFIQKVDEVIEEVEKKLEPFVEKGEEIIDGKGMVA